MANLTHLPTGTQLPVSARYVVGRSHVCQLRLSLPNISALHAELVWRGNEWNLLDLGSRNGTFVAGQRIGPGQRMVISRGAVLSFGHADPQYCFIDDSPPRLIAFGPDGPVVAEGEQLCLPSSAECEAILFRSADDRWLIETSDGTRPLPPEDFIVVAGQHFQVMLPGDIPLTRDVNDDRGTDGVLEFMVSRDREHVDLRFRQGHHSHEIESRAHAFLLLALARARVEDAARGEFPENEHGWMHREDLMRELAIDDPQLLNLWVYRARQQLAQLKLGGTAKIIERRDSTGQIRIGLKHVRIIDA